MLPLLIYSNIFSVDILGNTLKFNINRLNIL